MRYEIIDKHFELALCRHVLYHYAYLPPSRWSYGLLGSLGRTSRHAQTPCDFVFIQPRNVRCHQGHCSWSWPVWPQIKVYREELPYSARKKVGANIYPI